jgi:hypothetical protein
MGKADPMGGVPAPTMNSPQVQEWSDNSGFVIRVSTFFDVTTRAITGITVFRDAACHWTRIVIGLGPDGTPDSTTRDITVPSGTRVLTATQLNALASRGIATIDDFNSLQITVTAA